MNASDRTHGEKKLISKSTIDGSKPGDRQYVVWDSGDGATKGFGLLVLPSGVKSYVYQYRIGGRAGRTRRFTIGKHGSPWTPDTARKLAKGLAAKVRLGIDPIDEGRDTLTAKEQAKAAKHEAERRDRELLFSTYATRFLVDGMKSDARERTREGYRAALHNHAMPHIGSKALPAIARTDIVRIMDNIPGSQPSVRRLVFAVLRKLFNWAKGRGDVDASPLDAMTTPAAAASRDRVLADAELAMVLNAARQIEAPFGPMYLLLFATGQRRDEVAGLKWQELDRANATWILPGDRSKNGEANIVPLNRHAMAALDALSGQADAEKPQWPRKGLLFTTTGETHVSGFSRAKRRLDALIEQAARQEAVEAGNEPDGAEMAPWRLHDARRTLATALQRLGIRFEVTEAVLNHVSGSRSGVAGVYQRHGWGPEKRAALEAWADHCDRVCNPADETGNVVKLESRNGSLK